MPDWTKAQSDAIYADGSNILVSAAAGSGKTAVLVERVIRLITDERLDINLDELLVVTFTNAAAAEMKERISKALDKLIKKEPNNTNALRQLSLLPAAKICTIDSFCINLVREYFFRLDISQDFKILEEMQKAVLEQDVINEIIEELYSRGDDSFKALVELLSTTKSDSDLISAVKRLDNYITAQPFPFDWLEEMCELYNPEIGINESPLKVYAVSELKYAVDYILGVIDYTESVLYPEDELYDKYSETLLQDRAAYISLQAMFDAPWDEIRKVLFSLKLSGTPYKRGYESDVKGIVTENRKLYSGAKSLINTDIIPLFSASELEIKEDNAFLYPILRQLILLVREFHQRCFALKKDLNAYTFSDIEHFAIELLFHKDENGALLRSDIASEYERNFKEILVDEYQDTNTAQDTLFAMLSNGQNRFMVGDVKQSIYRFRLAMPQIFNNKKDRFTPYQAESESSNQKIIFDKNFRSGKGVCDYVNFLFSKLMTRRVGELDYTTEEYLNYNETSLLPPGNAVELNIIDVPEDENPDEVEARRIAITITDMVQNGEQVRDGDMFRPVKYGDFAVLLRSTKKRIDVYSEIFTQFGIPISAGNRTNLFQNNEVAVLLSLLRTVDNPTQDIPLLATLMSVFYGYTADEIGAAKLWHQGHNLYASIAADKAHFSAFLDDLERYRRYAASMSVEGFIRQILSDTSYLSVISAMGNYEQRRLNVMKLLSLARNFDMGENVGLTVFIRFVDSIMDNNVNYEGADVSGYDEDCVRIMSVHKSKGLEFPVCILAGTAHKYNYEDLNALVLLNSDYGIGLKVTNSEGLYRYNSLQYSCIKNMNSVAAMSENLRVLYVAITRAKDRFLAFAAFHNAEEKVNSFSKKLAGGAIYPSVVKKAQNDATLLILTALLHPDGNDLRRLCENRIVSIAGENSRIKVNLYSGDVSIAPSITTETPYDELLLKDIEKKLSFRYEHSELAAYASKRAASSLDVQEQSFRFFAAKVPSFISSGKLSGAEKGTAMHTFMQYCSYEAARSSLEAEIIRLTKEGYLSVAQADALDRKKLSALFNSTFCRRIFHADKLYRELKISSFVPLSAIEDSASDEKVLVQGIADCVFEENGALVLVDYKTDFVESEEELLLLYQKQIAFYKSAVEKTLHMPVKEAMLYSFCLEKCCIYK